MVVRVRGVVCPSYLSARVVAVVEKMMQTVWMRPAGTNVSLTFFRNKRNNVKPLWIFVGCFRLVNRF